MLTTDKMGNFGSGDCQALNDAFTSCDAGGGKGMARLYNANNKYVHYLSSPNFSPAFTQLILNPSVLSQ